MKIDEHYLKEAKRIREDYFKKLEFINSKKDIINSNKDEIERILEDMENLQKKIENDEEFGVIMNEKLTLIESSMNNIKDEIRPAHDDIEELRKDSSNLYSSISEKYPKLTVDDIKSQIINYIK